MTGEVICIMAMKSIMSRYDKFPLVRTDVTKNLEVIRDVKLALENYELEQLEELADK